MTAYKNSLAVLIMVWIFSGGVSAGMAQPAFRINPGVWPNKASSSFVLVATVWGSPSASTPEGSIPWSVRPGSFYKQSSSN